MPLLFSTTDRSRLDYPARRGELLRTLTARDFDVVVVGGGVVGCGVALDAAARGLTTALVEAGDLAGGSSCRAGRVLDTGLPLLGRHGIGGLGAGGPGSGGVGAGLGLTAVRELLTERDLLVGRLCPHLARPEPLLMLPDSRRAAARVRAAAAFADLLETTVRVPGRGRLPRYRRVGRGVARALVPALRDDRVHGALRGYDVSIDHARHTLLLARTAAALGTPVVTRCRAVGLVHRAGRIRGVRVSDEETGREHEVAAEVVVNATGAWCGRLREMAGARAIEVGLRRELEVTVRSERIDSRIGIVGWVGSGLVVVRRRGDRWVITGSPDPTGRSDPTHRSGSPDVTGSWGRAGPGELETLLGAVATWLRPAPQPSDVVEARAGWHPAPLPTSRFDGSTDLPHDRSDRVVVEDPPGLVTAVGGSYATYRRLAREVVDRVTERLRHSARGRGGTLRCRTDRLPLLGASGFAQLRASRRELARAVPAGADWVDHFLARYGSLATELLDMIDSRPDLGRPLAGAPGFAAVEVVYAVRAEGAMHLTDVLLRRTPIARRADDGGVAAAPEVARLMGELLGWSDARRREELDGFEGQRST